MHINDLLKIAVERRASDLHLKVGAFPVLRVDGVLRPMNEMRRLLQEDTMAMAFSIMTARQKEKFNTHTEIDAASQVPPLGRFRASIFQQRGTVGLVLRVIPTRFLTNRELLLPPVLERICMEQRGRVLGTGTTGSAKTTTLAAMVDHINTLRNQHIMTIEDPIEYLHRDKKSIVNQRELDVDTKAFLYALRSAMRQDPDVILVGEMRDAETIETALTAAETGHLVLSTLHTLDATETINRIITVFPPHQHRQIRLQLGAVLKAVISLRLMPRADGLGRVPAVEVLIATEYVRECIENKEKTRFIKDAIKAGTSQYGMQSFDQSLYQLYKSGLISLEEAMKQASNPNEFRLKIQGIQSTSDVAGEQMDAELEGPSDFAAVVEEESPFDFSQQPPGTRCTRAPRRTKIPGSGRKPPSTDFLSSAAARGRALRLLTVRARGREELRRSLEQKGFSAAAAREALERLEREGWLDDLAAARSVVRTRGGRYGRARIERELLARGFSEEIAAEALSEIDPDGEEKTLSRLFAKLQRSGAALSLDARRRRTWSALTRRGFPAAAISAKIKNSGDRKVSREDGEDEDS